MARFLLFALFLLSSNAFAKDCILFDQAPDNIGKTTCVTGKVLKVGETESGSFFLDFCENYRKCPFTVVLFRSSLKNVGDVRLLEGKEIEVSGRIKEWRGRAEIVLKKSAN
jgi:DNA/RNA endonuclease YhcR with UshA esterase domain